MVLILKAEYVSSAHCINSFAQHINICHIISLSIVAGTCLATVDRDSGKKTQEVQPSMALRRVCVSVFVCMCLCVYVFVHMCVCVYMCVGTCICVCICLFTCVCICLFTYVYEYVYVNVCECVCRHTCMCVYMCMYTM